MKNNDRNAYLLKNVIVFAFTIIATKLISFILVPIYTRYMSEDEFGIADLLFSIGSFIVPIVTLNISEAIYRFSMDKGSKKNEITSIIITVLATSIIVSTIIIPIISIFPDYSRYKYLYYVYIITTATSQVFSSNLKGQEKLKKLSFCNTLFTILVGMLNILFLVYLKMNIEGYFLAFIIANIITTIYAIFAGEAYRDIRNFRINKSLLRKMLKYSILLAPTAFMWWIINSSDRVMISSMLGESSNAIYAVAYKIPTLLTTLFSIFNSAWGFTAIKERTSKDSSKYSSNVYSAFMATIVITSLVILIIIKPFLRFYVPDNYFESWIYVPPLLISSVFLTLSNYLATFYTANKDSEGLLRSATMGAILNIILNLLLIQRIGINGAAIATCISYLAVYVYRRRDSSKYIKIKIEIKHITYFVLLIISSLLIYVDNLYGIIIQIATLICMCLISKNEISTIINKILVLLKNRIKKQYE